MPEHGPSANLSKWWLALSSSFPRPPICHCLSIAALRFVSHFIHSHSSAPNSINKPALSCTLRASLSLSLCAGADLVVFARRLPLRSA